MKKGLILLILLVITSSSLSQRYLLPFPVTASNGLPIRNGTFAIYDSSGATSMASLTYLSGEKYTYTTVLPSGYYDVKQKIGSTWYTYLNNIWLSTGQIGVAGGAGLIAQDTVSLKNLTAGVSDTSTVYLMQLDTANTNGGGFFVQMDSAYVEGVIAFDNATAGKQWVRDEYLQDNCARLEWFGAKGDNSTNDRTALYNALNSGFPLIGKSGKTYYSATAISITDKDINIKSSGEDKFTIRGDTSLSSGSGGFFLQIYGSTGSSTTVTDTIRNSFQYCIVDSVEFFNAGDIITIQSDATWFSGGTKGELHKISRTNGDTLFTEDKFWDVYDPAVETITVTKIDVIDFTMDNVVIKLDTLTSDNDAPSGLVIGYAKNLKITNSEIYNFQRQALSISYSYQNLVENTTIKNASTTVYGYGIVPVGSSYVTIDKCYFSGNYKGIDASGGFPTRNMKISGNYFNGNGFVEGSDSEILALGVHTHNRCENLTITDNTFVNCKQSGVTFKGSNVLIADNVFYGDITACIIASDHNDDDNQGSNYVIDNNAYFPATIRRNATVDTSLYYNTATYFFGFSESDTSSNCYYSITNNKAYGIRNYFVVVVMDTSTTILHNVIIANNVVRFYNPDASVTCRLVYGSAVFENSRLINNDVKVLSSNAYTKLTQSGFRTLDWTADNEYYIQDTLTTLGYAFTGGILKDYYWVGIDTVMGVLGADTVVAAVKDKGNYSLYFAGDSGNYAAVTDSTVTAFSTGNFAMGFWTKLDSIDKLQTFYSQYTSVDIHKVIDLTALNFPTLQMKTAKGAADSIWLYPNGANDTITANAWHWLAFSVDRADSNNCFVYIDGDTVSAYSHRDEGDGIDFTSIVSFPKIGRKTSTAGYVNGYMKNMVFWKDTTLSYSTNKMIYNLGKDADFSKAIGGIDAPDWYWDFHEGEGTITSDLNSGDTLNLVAGHLPTWVETEPTKELVDKSWSFVFLAPQISYQYGDSLLFTYLTSTASVYYAPVLPNLASGRLILIDSIEVYLNGDASSLIDAFSIIENAYGTATTKYTLGTDQACTGNDQIVTYYPNILIPETYTMLLKVDYTINTSVKTFSFKFYCSDN